MAKNALCAKIFYEIADILEIQDVQWKPIAYRKAARTIEGLSEDVEEIYARGGAKALMELPGIGEALAKKIEELIKTGTLRYYEELKKEAPFDLEAITAIPGMGPKKAKRLYDGLGIKTLDDLKKAAEKHGIAGIPGFDEKSEGNILKGIALLEKTKGRALLGNALPEAEKLVEALGKSGAVKRIAYAGSLRRMKETIGDIDILVTSSKPAKVADFFTKLPQVDEVVAKGETKSAVRLKGGMSCDLRVVEDDSFGAALQYFTGNKEHNIELRRIAIAKGWKLNEYGIFKGAKRIAGKEEEEVYAKLGLGWIPPELRENTGEVEAAQMRKLPKLVEMKDIKGDFHAHTKWSDGNYSIGEMAIAAEKLGYEYLAITDHASPMKVANGMDAKRKEKHSKEISGVQKKLEKEGRKIRLLDGCELDILKDGTLALPAPSLKKLDVVVGAVHSNFNMGRDEMTKRVVTALGSGLITILAHPSGRLIGERDAYQLDYDKIYDAAERNGVAMEINAFPERLDLVDTEVKRAAGRGLKLAIGTDSHSTEHLRFMRYGVAVARRGWCEKKDLLNSFGIRALEKFLE